MTIQESIKASFKKLKSNILLAKSFVDKTNAYSITLKFAADVNVRCKIEYNLPMDRFTYSYMDLSLSEPSWIMFDEDPTL